MDPEAIRSRVRLIPDRGGRGAYLTHPFNGRLQPLDHAGLDGLVRTLLSRIDVTAIDCVLGFPEGGSVPAYALGRAANRPVVLSSRLPYDVPHRITFEQPRSILGTTHHIYGIEAGQRVLIVEDELTTGGTTVNAVRALRGAGVHVDQVAALLAVDGPELWRRMREEGLTLHVGVTLAAGAAR